MDSSVNSETRRIFSEGKIVPGCSVPLGTPAAVLDKLTFSLRVNGFR